MNPESLQQLIATAAPLLAEVLTKRPVSTNQIRVPGSLFINFLEACPPDVKLLARAIDPDATYLFTPDVLRSLANQYPSEHVQAQSL